METIKCEMCGCVMAIASEVCPECGASVSQGEPKAEPQQSGARVPFKGLEGGAEKQSRSAREESVTNGHYVC